MVILEIDGQKYAGQSYIDPSLPPHEYKWKLEELAKEIAETVFVHYGYGGFVETVAVEPEWLKQREENNDQG